MALHVADGAEVVLLLAGPEREPDRPPRRDANRLQDADRLHRHRRTRAVVGRAGRRMPRVEVAAEHHHFVFQRRIGPRQLGDDVDAFHAVDELRGDAQRDLDGDFLVDHPHDAPVVLARDHERRIRRVPFLIVEAVDAHVFGNGARLDQRGDAFVAEKLPHGDRVGQVLVEVGFLFPVRLRRRSGRRIDRAFLLLQILVGEPLRFRLEPDVRLLRPPVHDDGAAQLAAILLEIRLAPDVDHDRRAADRRRRRRRPRPRIAGDAHVLRLGHLDVEVLQIPAASDRAVRFERRVGQPPARQLIARPLGCLLQARRSGEPRAVDVRQPAQGVHHLRVLKAFEP